MDIFPSINKVYYYLIFIIQKNYSILLLASL